MHTARPDSALVGEMRPEIAEWSSTFKTNVLLADIFDALTWFNATMMAKGTGKRPKKPKEYERSYLKKEKVFKKIMKVSEWFKLIRGEKEDG